MKSKNIIAIGTKNQAKIKAVRAAFDIFFEGVKTEYKSFSVDSGVGDQPIGLDKTISGAINRANRAIAELDTDNTFERSDFAVFGVGIEAGLIPIKHASSGYLDMQFTAIVHDERISLGTSSGFEYPQFVIDQILSGKVDEIGDVMEKLSGIENCKEKNGAIGYLTANQIKRSDILRNGVIMALLPFLNHALYNRKD